MRLNFEVTMLLIDRDFHQQTEEMLQADFANSELASITDYTERSLPYRFLVRVSRLLAPVQ